MTLTLTVRSEPWRRHVDAVARATPGLIPVIKGNGYGFGRGRLANVARTLSDTVAVGTVHELDVLDVLDAVDAWDGSVVVLTPTLQPPHRADPRVILTVGSPHHLAIATTTGQRVVVKLASSMQRYGAGIELLDAALESDSEVVAVSIHPPLVGDRRSDVQRWLAQLPADVEIWVSHLSGDDLAGLGDRARVRIRSGTGLWHGDKSALALTADVIDSRPVVAGTPVGYRQVPASTDGTLIMVGAGSAHGVRPRADGASPFHFARQRLALTEAPHMHTSMVLVPSGGPVPEVGAAIDVQLPLTTVWVDVIDWL